MFRSDDDAQRERIGAARGQAAWAEAEASRLLAELGDLNQRLSSGGRFPTEPPELRPPPPLELPPEADMGDLARLGAAYEVEVNRFDQEVALLSRLVEVQRSRVAKGADHLPLGPAPRKVPRGYLYAEWLYPTFAVTMIFLIIVSIGMSMAPIFGLPMWLLGSAAIIYALVRVRRRARARVAFLSRCVEAVDVRALARDHTSASLTDMGFRASAAQGWDVRRSSRDEDYAYNEIQYRVPGGDAPRSFRFRGGSYDQGVVLCDPESDEAYCVSQLHCRPRPDVYGRWQPGMTLGSKLSVIGTIITLLLWFGVGGTISFFATGAMVGVFIMTL